MGAEIPSGIKQVNFEHIVSEIRSVYTEDHNCVCVVVLKFAGKFLTRLSQRDTDDHETVIKTIGYCIKQTDSMLPWICTLIAHRGRRNVERTSVTLLAGGT